MKERKKQQQNDLYALCHSNRIYNNGYLAEILMLIIWKMIIIVGRYGYLPNEESINILVISSAVC